jgi:hypothetical protein
MFVAHFKPDRRPQSSKSLRTHLVTVQSLLRAYSGELVGAVAKTWQELKCENQLPKVIRGANSKTASRQMRVSPRELTLNRVLQTGQRTDRRRSGRSVPWDAPQGGHFRHYKGNDEKSALFSTFSPKAIGLKGRKVPDTTLPAHHHRPETQDDPTASKPQPESGMKKRILR